MAAILYPLFASTLIAAMPADKPAAPDKEHFVQMSVYEGLKEDGVSLKLAAALVENPDFVPKCMLCDQTRRALSDYAKLDKAPAAAPNKGLTPELAKGLVSANKDVRRAAFRDLIDNYVERGYARYDFTAETKKQMEQFVKAMEYKPKDGTLPNELKFCPSCDGACRKKPKLTM